MASGFSGGGGGPEFYGGGGRSIPGGPGTVINSGNNKSQPTYRNQIPGIFLNQIGNRISGGNGIAGKRTLADFQAVQQQQQSFHNQAAINAFLLRSVKPRTFQNLQSPTIDLTSVNDVSLFGGSSQRYGWPFLPNLRFQSQQQSDLGLYSGIRTGFGSGNQTLSGVPCIEPVQNPNRVEESENMLNSLRELEKQLLDDDDESYAQGGDDDVSLITHLNSDWLHSLVTPNPNPDVEVQSYLI